MRKIVLATLLITLGLGGVSGQEQDSKDPNIVLITLDGFRWQELFTGADPLLIANKTYVQDTTLLKARFWRETPGTRRKALLPFVWDKVGAMGQLHGNRILGSNVDLTNTMMFSYPGYNEILTGIADDTRIDSNDKINNPNTTLLEIANRNPRFKGKVGAFGSWDVFPYIVNEERSGVPVNAGFESATGPGLSERENFLNQLQSQIPSPWGTVRLDGFTHHYALEFMKRKHPKLIYIAYGETDDFAHDGDYEAYLNAAHNTDGMIKDLWNFTQQDEFYKDNTLFLITTDHGRGTKPLKTWKGHGSDINGAHEVWLMAFGKGVKALGEVDKKEQLYTNQLAPTILKLLHLKTENKAMKGNPLDLLSD